MSENVIVEPEMQLTWPNPLVENFDSNWPNLEKPDAEVESELLEHKQLLLRTVTWNLCAKPPPAVDQLTRILLPRNKFHLYFVGSEECERSIAQSAINPSKKNWELYLCEALGERYVPIRSHTLQAIHLMAFVHKSIAHLCSLVTSAAVATGAGNTMGNKGGVGVYLKFGDLKILVVNAHLAAHQNAEKQRNADFQKINRGIPSLLDKKSSIFSEETRLPTITEDKTETASSPAVVSSSPPLPSSTVEPSSSSIIEANTYENTKLSANIPPPINVHHSIDSTFGLAVITTPAMRKESVQVIGNEVDGEGPVQLIVNNNGNDIVIAESKPHVEPITLDGTQQPVESSMVEGTPVIQGVSVAAASGPTEIVIQPTLPIDEDPGDEDDGDPEEGTNTIDEGQPVGNSGSAPISTTTSTDGINNNNNSSAIQVDKQSPRPRSSSTELMSDTGGVGIAGEKTLDQSADVVIFMGDLNYRIKGNRAIVTRSLEANMHAVLLGNDQLKLNMINGLVLKNFTEPPLNFKPTYKLDVGTVSTYDTGPKHRIPAWADRILYVHNPQYLSCIAYNSDPSITTSDHKPIYASFVVQLESYVTLDSQQNIIGQRLNPKFTSESQVCTIM